MDGFPVIHKHFDTVSTPGKEASVTEGEDKCEGNTKGSGDPRVGGANAAGRLGVFGGCGVWESMSTGHTGVQEQQTTCKVSIARCYNYTATYRKNDKCRMDVE